MALPPEALRLVQLGLQTAARAGCVSQRVLSLGYPDILASPEQLGALIGTELMAGLRYRPDSEAIARWHQVSATVPKLVDATHFFALLGYDLEVLDIAQARGGEILHDLNQPVPPRLHRRYALVIDPGTLEHCFDIAQAAKNIAEMVAAGGCVFHGNPLNMFNHGFYNLSPTWYHDFYSANGFALERLQAVADPVGAMQRFEVPATKRFGGMPENCALYVLARRTADLPVRWPMQSKYVSNPDLKG
jgi:hypothetical protein